MVYITGYQRWGDILGIHCCSVSVASRENIIRLSRADSSSPRNLNCNLKYTLTTSGQILIYTHNSNNNIMQDVKIKIIYATNTQIYDVPINLTKQWLNKMLKKNCFPSSSLNLYCKIIVIFTRRRSDDINLQNYSFFQFPRPLTPPGNLNFYY